MASLGPDEGSRLSGAAPSTAVSTEGVTLVVRLLALPECSLPCYESLGSDEG